MKSRTQLDWVVSELKTKGKVSRNDALKVFITRLGSIICNLNKAGWNLKGKNERVQNGYGRGLDYVYKNKSQ